MIYVLSLLLSLSAPAFADDEISCATDNTCIQDKVDAGEKEFKRQQRREARKARRKDKYVPCAGDDDCQRGKLDAIDHGRGEKVED